MSNMNKTTKDRPSWYPNKHSLTIASLLFLYKSCQIVITTSLSIYHPSIHILKAATHTTRFSCRTNSTFWQQWAFVTSSAVPHTCRLLWGTWHSDPILIQRSRRKCASTHRTKHRLSQGGQIRSRASQSIGASPCLHVCSDGTKNISSVVSVPQYVA